MNIKLHKTVVCLAVSFTALNVFGQDSTGRKSNDKGVGNQEVVVVKEYEATIQDAQKINISRIYRK